MIHKQFIFQKVIFPTLIIVTWDLFCTAHYVLYSILSCVSCTVLCERIFLVTETPVMLRDSKYQQYILQFYAYEHIHLTKATHKCIFNVNIQQHILYKTKVTILYNQNERNMLAYKFGCINAVKGRYKLLSRQHVSYSKLRSINGSFLRIIELHGKQILHSKQITYIAPNYKIKK